MATTKAEAKPDCELAEEVRTYELARCPLEHTVKHGVALVSVPTDKWDYKAIRCEDCGLELQGCDVRAPESAIDALIEQWNTRAAGLAPAGEAMLGAVLKLVADSKDGYVNGLDVTNLITGLSPVARVPVVAEDQDSD